MSFLDDVAAANSAADRIGLILAAAFWVIGVLVVLCSRKGGDK